LGHLIKKSFVGLYADSIPPFSFKKQGIAKANSIQATYFNKETILEIAKKSRPNENILSKLTITFHYVPRYVLDKIPGALVSNSKISHLHHRFADLPASFEPVNSWGGSLG
jgi:hypothetical protein